MIELHVRSGSVAHWPARPLNPQLSTNLLPPVPDQRPFDPRGSSLYRRPLPLNHEHSTLNHFITQVTAFVDLYTMRTRLSANGHVLRIHKYEAMNSLIKKRSKKTHFIGQATGFDHSIHSEGNNLNMKPTAMKLR